MSDNKNYYYLKLKENFFDTEEIKILESAENGYLYSNILLKIYLKSLKSEGRLMFRENIPYNSKMISAVTGHNIDVVEKAIKIFAEIGLIQLMDSGAIYISDIQSFVGKSSSEADRKRLYRSRIDVEKMGHLSGHVGDKLGTNLDDVQTEIHQSIEYRDKSLDIIDISYQEDRCGFENQNTPPFNYKKIINLYNSILSKDLPAIKSLTDKRKKLIKLRHKQIEENGGWEAFFNKIANSKFLLGENDRNWTADFDWILKESNFIKILEDCYANKQGNVENTGHISEHKFSKNGARQGAIAFQCRETQTQRARREHDERCERDLQRLADEIKQLKNGTYNFDEDNGSESDKAISILQDDFFG